ncbi:hypothetical protein [Methylocystis sp.]|uniref:hypothetical protein n=1 Tax=Methylocystis sp. TaxID=1911079 RepID=UPI002734CE2D|nr:hypothetical protein [Methylocystis sp.]
MKLDSKFKKTAHRIGCFMALLRSKSAMRFVLEERAKACNAAANNKLAFALSSRTGE